MRISDWSSDVCSSDLAEQNLDKTVGKGSCPDGRQGGRHYHSVHGGVCCLTAANRISDRQRIAQRRYRMGNRFQALVVSGCRGGSRSCGYLAGGCLPIENSTTGWNIFLIRPEDNDAYIVLCIRVASIPIPICRLFYCHFIWGNY